MDSGVKPELIDLVGFPLVRIYTLPQALSRTVHTSVSWCSPFLVLAFHGRS